MPEIVKSRDIRSLSLADIENYLTEKGEKPFRARQVYEWLWKKSAHSFDEMSNLSKPLRAMLDRDFKINHVSINKLQKSSDGTMKFGFRLYDGLMVEGVLIPEEHRMTACVSSQAGCSLSCKFCATGFLDLKRNLNPDEIYDQVVLINRQALEHFNMSLTNIVFMGMGEPLLNYKNVLKGIEKINDPNGLGMSNRRITVSTAGIAKMIKKLGDDKVKFKLALSLHAANDKKRSELMPINDSNSLDSLMEALDYFYSKTHNRITFEYILLDGVNDSLQDAEELAGLCRRVPAMVNVIEYNPVEAVPYKKAKSETRDKFVQYLESKGITVKVRRSRGKDIDAACGQLANRNG